MARPQQNARLRAVLSHPPVIAAWGAGVDSTAMIIELVERGETPDMVLIAQMPEKPQTLSFIPIFQAWMDTHRVPYAVVRYEPRRFKHWPPYADLLENCLTNGTLPSIAFSRSSCSLKWKVEPQDRWVKAWEPVRQAWKRGQKVVRLIGYDCSPRDNQRYAHQDGHVSDLFDYRFPLREWGWTRDDCIRRIEWAGLPQPAKSSCFFCTGMKPNEVRALPRGYLRLIILMEARAAPRLRTVEGLWRKGTKGMRGREARPGSMTEFIRTERLLPFGEIDDIVAHAPADLIAFLDAAASVPLVEREPLRTWLDRFNSAADRLAA
ncbi:hypothetical protein [Sphingobium fluviale]|uniref:Phosphoadenosine phosphosulphate reductase domain-containing protein n=1 Tax=Sphingobium fluviale TaxID=2506423 RepID=A0A4Q1KLR4_9SPHN|nr:hypothetical protein [Sphingobium fluviale]RXR30883.1 hypothetical protein EQG66_00910 [Sphingobium fluviale]